MQEMLIKFFEGIDIEDLGKGQRQAVAARPRDCTMCRECVRRPGWAETVRLSRVPNHFIFSVECFTLPGSSM